MPGRSQHQPGINARSRWAAAGVALGAAGAATAVALLSAGPASAAATPSPNYHGGSDKAVFTVTGVEDSNCLVSTGGNTVYIKPGDRIDFSSALAGVSADGLNLQGGKLTGLNVHAVVDSGRAKRSFNVPAGKTVKFKGLSTGTHKLAWNADSASVLIPEANVPVVGSLVNKVVPAHTIRVSLINAQLKSGAKLSWSGTIHVTKSAAQCKISVSTPKVQASAGPVHVTVPPVNVSVPGVTEPTGLPTVPKLHLPTGAGDTGAPATKSKSSAPSYKYTPPAESVPDQVVPQGDSGGSGGGYAGGYQVGSGTGSESLQKLSLGSDAGSGSGSSGSVSDGKTTSAQQDSTGDKKTIDLASSDRSDSPSGELPVILAILAIIALAMVAGVYARLYLLGRKS